MMSKNKSNNEMSDYDGKVALALHQRYNQVGLTENAIFPEDGQNDNKNYRPRTLIDDTLEIVDPTPNIYTLFTQFDARFFSNKLVSVEVKWSQRMTSCAGICSFHSRSRDCVISLSAPLLKLRPRKDLVETLLHEMIHGYLFLTNNNRERDSHGHEFCKIMDRINREAGTQITIYHSFHDEVKLYQQHWWRCDGPCQKRPPYFGMVRRAMNRAPGPSDFWWASHRQRCDGIFIKVREPEKKILRSKGRNVGVSKSEYPKEKAAIAKPKKNNLNDWLARTSGKTGVLSTDNVPMMNPIASSKSSGNFQPELGKPGGLVKLGAGTSNIHGWGIGGPGSSSSVRSSTPEKGGNSGKKLNFAGTLGGAGTGRSNLLDKYYSPRGASRELKPPVVSTPTIEECPPVKKPRIIESSSNDTTMMLDDREFGDMYDCPICNLPIRADYFNEHLDICLINQKSREGEKKSAVIEIFDSPEKRREKSGTITSTPLVRNLDSLDERRGKPRPITLTPLRGQSNLDSFVTPTKKASENLVSCPVCDKVLDITALYDHLDKCAPEQWGSEEDTKIEEKHVNPSKPTSSKDLLDPTDGRASFNTSYVCLVCNLKICGDIALTDHLEECVKAIFKDDSFDVSNETISAVPSPKSEVTDKEFPCPVCMILVQESFMNEHLDCCLLDKK